MQQVKVNVISPAIMDSNTYLYSALTCSLAI